MIMAGAANLADLERYAFGIERLLVMYKYWPTIQTADRLCRLERWDRMADSSTEDPPAGYNPKAPWGKIIFDSMYSPKSTGPLAEWWHFRVVHPLSHDAGNASEAVDAYEHMRLPGSTARTLGARPKAKAAQRHNPGSSGSTQGTFCWGFQSGTCINSPCRFAHRCSLRGCNHPSKDCRGGTKGGKTQEDPAKGKGKHRIRGPKVKKTGGKGAKSSK